MDLALFDVSINRSHIEPASLGERGHQEVKMCSKIQTGTNFKMINTQVRISLILASILSRMNPADNCQINNIDDYPGFHNFRLRAHTLNPRPTLLHRRAGLFAWCLILNSFPTGIALFPPLILTLSFPPFTFSSPGRRMAALSYSLVKNPVE